MTNAQYEELNNLHRAMVAAGKRLDDALAAVERVRDELTEIHRASLILRDSFMNPVAEEPLELWRLPSGPVA